MGRDVASEMKSKWYKAAQKIVTIVEEEKEDNLCMRRFLTCHSFDEETTGMNNNYICAHAYVALLCSR